VSVDDDVSLYIYILIHTISFIPQSTMKVNIHNQCSDLNLKLLGYFDSGIAYRDEYPIEVDPGNMKSVDLTPSWAVFEGIIMYKLESRYVKPGNQPEPTDILLLMAWKSEGYKNFCVFVQLIEYNKWSYGGVIKAREYYQGCANQLCTYTSPIKDTWFIPDGTVLMTELELDFTQRDGVLNMTISEGIRDEHTKKLEWITPNK
jgi:hypothetical protein